ncbi:MAG: L,D-transpeptidase family protein [Jatrophihabitans sp.]
MDDVPMKPAASRPMALLATAGVLGGLLVAFVTGAVPAAARTAVFPVPVNPGSSEQVITVSANPGSTVGTLKTWEKTATGWVAKFPAQTAHIGSAGLTKNARDDFPGTPIGQFSLTESFGRQSDPGTAMPYFKTDNNDWWGGDKASKATYNNHVRCAPGHCPMKESLSEHLKPIGAVYDYSVVINYNRFPAVSGKGAAFFLHVTDGTPTAGCVAISRSALISVLRWLNPAKHPIIAINTPKSTSVVYNLNPIGSVGPIPGPSSVTANGWAWDPDAPTTPVVVHVYLDGKLIKTATANLGNASVASMYPQAGSKHGYSIPVPLTWGASHQLCVYADNLGPAGATTKLSCATVATQAEWFLRPAAAPGTTWTKTWFGTSPVATATQALLCDMDGTGRDQPATFLAGKFYYRTAAGATKYARFGTAGDLAVCGDWNNDGKDTLAVFRPGNGTFYLMTSIAHPSVFTKIRYGTAGDQPLAGDWNGSGRDYVGVFRPATHTAYLGLPTVSVHVVLPWAAASGSRVITGDWNGDGVTTLGAHRAATWTLSNQRLGAAISTTFQFGRASDRPVSGRFGSSHTADAIGVVR